MKDGSLRIDFVLELATTTWRTEEIANFHWSPNLGIVKLC